MSSDWQETTLGKLAEINPRRPISKGEAAPFIEMAALPTHSRDIEKSDIAFKDFSGGGAKFKNGDTLLARITPCLENGKTSLVSGLIDGQCAFGSTEFIVIGPRAPEDKEFLYYLARSESFRSYAISRMEGTSGRQRVPSSAVEGYRLVCPPKSLRAEIGRTLGALDDCIAILRETNATLEAMAQAIFKSWFVDFDPVRAKAEGRQPERMDGATAALFPDSFEDSELGEVPAGWSVFPIGELVKCVGGATPSTKNSEFWEPAEFAWTTPKDLSGLQSPILHKTEKMVSSKGVLKISSGLLPAGTLLMSSRAPIGYLAISSIAVAVNQGYIAIPPGGKLSPLYLLHWCRQNMELIKSHANGSTFMEISKKAFRPLPALLPSVEVLAEFTKRVSPIFESIAANDRQINLLAEIRDTLLPKLISGEIRLPEAESIVRSAVNA